MARITKDLCVGCPQGCVSCGRKNAVVIVCDVCDAEIGFNEDVFYEDGKELCPTCWEENYGSEEEE